MSELQPAGAAEVTEEDYLSPNNRRFSVDKVTPGFSVQNVGSAVTEMEIACSECNLSARPIDSCSAKANAVTPPALQLNDKIAARQGMRPYFRSLMLSPSAAKSK